MLLYWKIICKNLCNKCSDSSYYLLAVPLQTMEGTWNVFHCRWINHLLSFVWDEFVKLTFWGAVFLENYESDGAWRGLEFPWLHFKDMLYILNYDGFHGKHQNEKQEEWQLWKKRAVDGFFQEITWNVLITWNSVRNSVRNPVKNRSSRMFMYIQTDVWVLTFPLHSVVDCVPNSESLYKGPLTASQTGGVGSSLHLLLL